MLNFAIAFNIFKQLGAEAQAESPTWNHSTGKLPRYGQYRQWIYARKGIHNYLDPVYVGLWEKVMLN